jgi:hypothetical protein
LSVWTDQNDSKLLQTGLFNEKIAEKCFKKCKYFFSIFWLCKYTKNKILKSGYSQRGWRKKSKNLESLGMIVFLEKRPLDLNINWPFLGRLLEGQNFF